MLSSRMMSTAPISAPLPSSSTAVKRLSIPGGHGWPVLGPLWDKLNYFWFQGPEKFFAKQIAKHNSRVFRTNMPPAFPFFARVNPNVIAVLDVKSFSHLFDMEIVEKENVLVGDFMPSVNYTGGVRVCAYLDTSDPKHEQIKNFVMQILKQSSSRWVPTMLTSLDTLWESLESSLAKSRNGGVSLQIPVVRFLFSFLSRTLLRADPATTPVIANYGHIMIGVWLAFQLIPTVSLRVSSLLQPLVELFLHSFTYPFWLVKGAYSRLASFVKDQAAEVVAQGQAEFQLTEKEAVHNLLFTLGFNAFGGFVLVFNKLVAALGGDKSLHERLRKEVRETLEKNNNVLDSDSVRQMELVHSFVYETLRLNPPVPLQYARARRDFDLAANDGVYAVRKGELLCGYQPLVMKDPAVFENPEEFVYDRFTREKGGQELLKYLFWSNGPQSGGEGPSAANKQCPARDVVPLTSALFLADMFNRYDDITITSGSITALKKSKLLKEE